MRDCKFAFTPSDSRSGEVETCQYFMECGTSGAPSDIIWRSLTYPGNVRLVRQRLDKPVLCQQHRSDCEMAEYVTPFLLLSLAYSIKRLGRYTKILYRHLLRNWKILSKVHVPCYVFCIPDKVSLSRYINAYLAMNWNDGLQCWRRHGT